jgi:hypothetical protein
MTTKPSRSFTARPRDPDARSRTAGKNNGCAANNSNQRVVRLTINVTPELHGRIKIITFPRGGTCADMLLDMLTRALLECHGDKP